MFIRRLGEVSSSVVHARLTPSRGATLLGRRFGFVRGLLQPPASQQVVLLLPFFAPMPELWPRRRMDEAPPTRDGAVPPRVLQNDCVLAPVIRIRKECAEKRALSGHLNGVF